MIDAATGAGKSMIIAEIARVIHGMTGKRVLVTAPTKELVVQDRNKYLATGNPASMFSAGAGEKSLRHPVVFGSPLTIRNRISSFKHNFALVIPDECDLLTPTLLSIVDAMREGNPNLRVCGLTATPYRLGSGYIFREWPDGRVNGADRSRDPFFRRCVYQIHARELISQGYLSPPIVGATGVDGYDTGAMQVNAQGKFSSEDVDRAYHGHGRKTAAIVHDIVDRSRGRNGVLIYAATVRHAQEVLASLPPELSGIITGETSDRDDVLNGLKSMRLKYVVNVGVLTVGVDVPHVDVIAVLRKTESVRLLQQIIGRGLRTYEGKTDCLYLDYTTNMADHAPDGDLFSPEIKAKGAKIDGKPLKCLCPDCGYENEFSLNPDYEEYQIDENGYCLDVFGARIETDYGPLAAHYGRRCMGYVDSGTERGKLDRCGYYWTSKICEECNAPNDIAARYCRECRAEIVDPNAKLIGEFKAMKRDPTRPQCDEVTSMTCRESISQKGNKTLRVDWVTPFRQFATWLSPDHKGHMQQEAHKRFMAATNGGVEMPKSIAYVKDIESGFFRIMGYNWAIDEAPEERQPLKKSA